MRGDGVDRFPGLTDSPGQTVKPDRLDSLTRGICQPGESVNPVNPVGRSR